MYLMVENNGVSDVEAFTLLGVSTTRNATSTQTIGMFGSGMKHTICLFLRHKINPVMFLGNLRLEFFSKEKNVKGIGYESNVFNQVCARVTGKDSDGKQINRTEKLGFTTEFGELDWTDVGMGIREIISNALDASYKLLGNANGAKILIVEDNQVRAKSEYTRIFIPYVDEVVHYYENINNHFLHFSTKEDVYVDKIFDKYDQENGKIYRRGVLVGSLNERSAFNYNVRDIDLDESRNIKSYAAVSRAVNIWQNESPENIARFLVKCHEQDNDKEVFWELKNFTEYNLGSLPYYDVGRKKIIDNWNAAWQIAFGKNAVLCTSVLFVNRLEKKGFRPISFKIGSFSNALKNFEIPNETTCLLDEEKLPYNFREATPSVRNSLNDIWIALQNADLTMDKNMPEVKCYSHIMNEGKIRDGFHEFGTNKIFIHSDISETETSVLRRTILEEVAHYVTGATDMSRDFQDYVIKAAIAFMDKAYPEFQEEEEGK